MARKLKDYPTISLRGEDLSDKIDFRAVFGRAGAVHIEIGSGRGTFLLNQAKSLSDDNFLGIEWANRYYRHAVDRIGRWGLENVRIMRTDAVEFIANFVGDNCVDFFHIYFPDPWPKKKHHKRRFLCAANMEHLIRTLKSAGQIRIATDHSEYFEEIRRLAAERGGRVEEVEFLPTAGAEGGELTGTNYERKYLKRKMTVHTLALRKIAGD